MLGLSTLSHPLISVVKLYGESLQILLAIFEFLYYSLAKSRAASINKGRTGNNIQFLCSSPSACSSTSMLAIRIVIHPACSREFSIEQLEDGRALKVLVLIRKVSIIPNRYRCNIFYPCGLDVRLSRRRDRLQLGSKCRIQKRSTSNGTWFYWVLHKKYMSRIVHLLRNMCLNLTSTSQ
jgi:hypothetical protein